MNNHKRVNVSQNVAKYKNSKSLLLVVLILSAINVILPIAGVDIMFYYASFLGSLFSLVGAEMALLYGNNTYVAVGTVLSVLTIVPYLVAYILSEKKKVGSMITATVFFAIDTIVMTYYSVTSIMAGALESSLLAGVIIHIVILVFFILSIGYAKKIVEEEKKMAETAEAEMVADAVNADSDEPAEEAQPRTITITRQKKLIGCAIVIVCYANGREICRLKNGQSTQVTVDSNAFELGAALSNGFASGKISVAAGTAPLAFTLRPKSGAIAGSIVIEQV